MEVPKQQQKTQDIAETNLCSDDGRFSKAETGSQTRIGHVRLVPLAEETDKPSEDRIVMLSDGIFAIAITLLVLGIQIPLADTHANTPQAHAAFIQALTIIRAHLRP
jgi:magnesium-transporting ATPase (P-type)